MIASGIIVCQSCVHRVSIGRLRTCFGSTLAFYRIHDENRAKLKIPYSCGYLVSKSARYDATLTNNMSIFNQTIGISEHLCLKKGPFMYQTALKGEGVLLERGALFSLKKGPFISNSAKIGSYPRYIIIIALRVAIHKPFKATKCELK